MKVRIGLIGDHDPTVTAHRAIPLALERTGAAFVWLPTHAIGESPERLLSAFDGLWSVPKTPYASTEGALAAIRFARLAERPFLGTCGGFQHALLEWARGVWGLADAAHAELDPAAAEPVIAPLACALVERTGVVRFVPGSRLAAIYGREAAVEGYHCSYGLSPRYAARLGEGPLCVGARDEAGDVRAVELEGHPFFVGTLFQPERSALEGRDHPLISAFVEAARAPAARSPH